MKIKISLVVILVTISLFVTLLRWNKSSQDVVINRKVHVILSSKVNGTAQNAKN